MSLTTMWGLEHRDAIKKLFDDYGYTDAVTSSSNPNRMRKQNIAQRLRLYRNDADTDYAAAIDAAFTDAKVRKQRKKLIPMSTYENVTKRIVDEVASLYNRPAIRTLSVNDDAYRAITKQARLDSVMKEAQRMLFLCNDVLMMCLKRADGQFRLRVITPDLFSAIPSEDDPTELAAVLIDRKPEVTTLLAPKTGTVCYDLWDDTYHYQLGPGGAIIKLDEHGMGRLPCVLMHAQEPGMAGLLRADYGQDIISAHLAVFLLNVMTVRLAKSQGERQPIFVGDAAQNASSQSSDGESPICLQPGSQAFMLDSKTSPDHYLMTKRDIKAAVGQTYGLSYAQMSLTDDSSGKMLEQQREKLKELRDEQRLRGDLHERAICEMLGFDASTLNIDFTEQTIAMDAADEVALLQSKMKLGLDSPIDYLMRKNPDFNRDTAMLEFTGNIADYAMLIETVRALNAPAPGSDPGESPHVNGTNNDGSPTLASAESTAP